jgi:lysophospholipase L1-like esterase
MSSPSPAPGARPGGGPLLSNLLLALLSAGAVLVTAETALRSWAPVSLATIGHPFGTNAERYGWGFEPRETVLITDPDTGQVSVEKTNAAGWRDRDHSPGRVPGVFRILVLGDSLTYGAIVPLDDIYTRRLERLLLHKGYAAEVISIGLGGWGTDQELEALRLEGLSYEPDLVVVQFCSNDPRDNQVTLKEARKPFRYELGPSGSLLRLNNPWFVEKHRNELAQLRWERFRDRLEILKRGALLLRRLQGRARPTVQPVPSPGVRTEYVVADWGLLLLSDEFGIDPGSGFATWLKALRGHPLPVEKFRRRVASIPQASRSEEILRTFENRWFRDKWVKQYTGGLLPPQSNDVRLMHALLDEMLRLSRQVGAPLLVFSTHDRGMADWDRYWFHLAAGPEIPDHFLAQNDMLKEWARTRGMDFLVPDQPITRARNDPHPNQQGNEVMARALAAYLENRYGAVMPRRDGQPSKAPGGPAS